MDFCSTECTITSKGSKISVDPFANVVISAVTTTLINDPTHIMVIFVSPFPLTLASIN